MAFSPDFRTLPGASGTAQTAVFDAGLRAYMLRIFNWMASGLVLTGACSTSSGRTAASTPLGSAC
jgi:FtsH-binding integral membrane protein